MQASMSRAYNGGRKHFLLWSGAANPGATRRLSYQDARTGLDPDVLTGWTLAVGAADLDADLLPEVYFANDFGPDRLLHNLSRPGCLALRSAGRKAPSDHAEIEGAGPGLLQGDGRGVRRSERRRAAGHLRQQHHHGVRAAGEPACLSRDGRNGAHGPGRGALRDDGERLGLARTGWCWEARAGDFDNDGVPELMQATGFVNGAKNRWPELQELAMGNDALLHLPGCWPHVRQGDDLSGHSSIPFFVRSGSGRYVDLSRETSGSMSPQVSRGIATADVDGDGDLDFAVANQWEASYFYRNDAPSCGSFLGLHLLLPLRPGAPGSTDGARRVIPASTRRAGPPLEPPPPSSVPNG